MEIEITLIVATKCHELVTLSVLTILQIREGGGRRRGDFAEMKAGGPIKI